MTLSSRSCDSIDSWFNAFKPIGFETTNHTNRTNQTDDYLNSVILRVIRGFSNRENGFEENSFSNREITASRSCGKSGRLGGIILPSGSMLAIALNRTA